MWAEPWNLALNHSTTAIGGDDRAGDVTRTWRDPRDAQRAVPPAEVASQARSILSLFSDKGSERAL
jgi:hypothetical protein